MDAKKNRGTLDRTLPTQKLQVTSKPSVGAAESGGVLAKYGRLRFRTSTMRWPRITQPCLWWSTALWCATSECFVACLWHEWCNEDVDCGRLVHAGSGASPLRTREAHELGVQRQCRGCLLVAPSAHKPSCRRTVSHQTDD